MKRAARFPARVTITQKAGHRAAANVMPNKPLAIIRSNRESSTASGDRTRAGNARRGFVQRRMARQELTNEGCATRPHANMSGADADFLVAERQIAQRCLGRYTATRKGGSMVRVNCSRFIPPTTKFATFSRVFG